MHIFEAVVAVALVALGAEARAVAQEDVKGVKPLLQDEARDDPFFDHNPQYDFAYRIHDEETGDAKDQNEERRGDAVQGSYSVVDPDGTLRVVRYTADDANGFNAVVSLTPGHSKPIVPPVKSILQQQQQRLSVVQHHVDVPVPVQHHVLPSTSANMGNRRVLVEHPQHQSSAQLQQHLIQPPLALGVHQDVHHLIPQAGYHLHQIHGTAGIHQMAVPIIQVQDQAGLIKQEMGLPILQIQQQQQQQQQEQDILQQQTLLQQQEQGLMQQQEQGFLKQQLQQQQQGIQATAQQQQQQQQEDSITITAQQQDQQQQDQQQQDIQQGEPGILMEVADDQQQQQQQQQSSSFSQEQQQTADAELSLPQVIEVRHSVQPVQQQQALHQQQQQALHQQQHQQFLQQQQLKQQPLQQQQLQQQPQQLKQQPLQQQPLQQQQQQLKQQSLQQQQLKQQPVQQQQPLQQQPQQQLQLRSLDSDDQQQLQQVQQQIQQQQQQVQVLQLQQAFPHQRTLAVYRTSPLAGGLPSGNFVRFSSPYAQYTIS